MPTVRSKSSARIVLAATGSSLALAAAGWIATGHRDDELSGWIEAVATLGALLAAVVAALYASGAFRLELAREQTRIDADRRAQAGQVAAWLHFVADVDSVANGTIFVSEVWVVLRNSSELPVTGIRYDVLHLSRLDGEVHEQHMAGAEMGVLPPDSGNLNRIWESGRLVDQAQYEFNSDRHEAEQHFGVVLSFRDSSGVLWRRDWRGHLSEVLEIE